MVKQIRAFKSDNFYKNDDANGGAMAAALAACDEHHIVIHSQTKKNGRLWGCVKPQMLLTLLEKNNGIYEVIHRFPHKVYFDIDGKVERQHTQEEFQQWMDATLVHITPFFPNAVLAISGSNTEHKISLHVVLQNYVIHNEEERQYMKHLVKYIHDTHSDAYDWKVYTKNRNMKCIRQSKDDGRVQEIFANDDFKAHCITIFVPDYSLPFIELPQPIKEQIQIAKSKGTFDLAQLPKLDIQTPETFNILSATPSEILAAFPLNSKDFNHDYTHLVARFCFYNNISFEAFLAWLQQKHTDLRQDIISKWRGHWNRIENFPPVSRDKAISILRYFYPNITKDIHYRRFADTFHLPTENIELIETIHQGCFVNANKKYFVFNVGMGGGKTAQTIDALRYEPNFLWIAPNRALATNTQKRFEIEDIETTHYEKVSTKDKKAGHLANHTRLICCLNSIHYLGSTTYNVLVIDEIETLIDKFLGDFLEQGTAQLKQQIWNQFINLFRRADKVILLDAFITTKTTKLIMEIEKTLFSTVIYQRICEPQTRTITYMGDNESMLYDIITKLKQGNKLFIFYPYKNACRENKSMEQIYGAIIESTGKKGIFYNADVDDKKKAGLRDVNESWNDKDFVITNNIITCGVNYERLDFDYKYIFIAPHNSPRDIIQVSYRARHLNSGIIKICYMGKMMQPTAFLKDCDKMEWPIYTTMYNQIIIEKEAPLKRAFQLFCVKAKYKQKTDDYKINATIEADLKKLLNEQSIGMSYSKIPEIDWSYAEHIEEKCFAQEATMLEKYALNKYYFKKSFVDSADEDTLAFIWDEKYAFFFQQLSGALQRQNNVFTAIADLNNLPNLFPTIIKKTKLNDSIKADIFKQFHFKFITGASSVPKILKEIYNTHFGRHIITTTYDNAANQNVIYQVDAYVSDLCAFAKENLILDKLTSMTFNAALESSAATDGLQI